jgi:ATP-binding cassette subfamily C protein LapB
MGDPISNAWLRPLLRPLRPVFLEIAGLSFFVNLLALAVPVFVLQVYDRVIFHAGLNTLTGLAAGMVVVLTFDFVLRQARARLLQRVALRIDIGLGRRLFESIAHLPLLMLERRPTGAWQALFRDADVLRNTLSGPTALLACDLPFIALFLALIVLIATPVAWIVLAVLPVFAIVAWRSASTLTRQTGLEQDSLRARDTLLAEWIAGRTTVKALALDRATGPMWEARQAEVIDRAIARGIRADGYANLGTTLTLITTVTITTVGALAILDQRMTVGALIAANMLSGRLLAPLGQLVANWRTFAAFRQAAHRVGEILEAPQERQASAVQMPRAKGRIVLDDVVFAYPGMDGAASRLAVDGVSVVLAPGAMTAIVGPNGSGKSTLLKLIQGLYPPDRGRVRIDGADVRQFSRADLAGWIGYLPQETVLFAGSIRANIALRDPGCEDGDVLKAAMAAGVHGAIVDLADGYATEVGEAGARLSAGQRQKIGLARAVLGQPPMLLLDEPTSHLDRAAEMDLRASLLHLAKDRTIIVVTHSAALLSACGTIIVMDGGVVVRVGSAADVLPALGFGATTPAASRRPGPSIPRPSPGASGTRLSQDTAGDIAIAGSDAAG